MSNHLNIFFLLLILCGPTNGRFITRRHSSYDVVSDGGVLQVHASPYLALNRLSAADSCCDQAYGFLPCTTSALGNLFLILVYGYFMFLAATYLSDGSELLLEILGPGIVGGLLLPILGAAPDSLIILASGLSGTTADAQSQVSVGMGLLAGSTVMLLTILWGSCVIVGKCDLVDSKAMDEQNTKGYSLTESGVSTDIWACYTARIMAISVIPFVIVQIPLIFNSTSWRRLAVLIGLIVSLLLLASYCLYQVLQPWIQKRKLAYVKHTHVIVGLLKHLRQRALGRLHRDDGSPNDDVIDKLFSAIDTNKDGNISKAELRVLIVGIEFEEIDDLDQEDAVDRVMKEFDTSHDEVIDKDEFVQGIKRWLRKLRLRRPASCDPGPHTTKFLHDYHHEVKREEDLLDVRDQCDEVVGGVVSFKWKAVLLLVLGAIIAVAFADPLVDAVDNFSAATSIPAFFISFIVLPLATNSCEAVSTIITASRNKRKTASLTFSELYGAATMRNVLSLSVFLALVYMRGLPWDFTAEMLVVLIVCVVMGALGSFRTHYPLWTSILAILLYPFSLALVYVFHSVFGWS
ncbi:sodium/calcium exchanger NCL-like isoform X2 [Corylus avellana]|uniref:sodium/calcium exchanger NCL-like isoform X2 n=1 Tax=Corylus avellana TaxID=13451 RepID=UPI00286A0924|nr:sodium/calcium exchanger NCL-like isoform X2 [Corylus avellana]